MVFHRLRADVPADGKIVLTSYDGQSICEYEKNGRHGTRNVCEYVKTPPMIEEARDSLDSKLPVTWDTRSTQVSRRIESTPTALLVGVGEARDSQSSQHVT